MTLDHPARRGHARLPWLSLNRLHEIVEKNVDPTTALKVGLKVDANALPPGILEKVDLKSPATTVALLKMNAIVGLQATVDANNHITRLGVTCALCHRTCASCHVGGSGTDNNNGTLHPPADTGVDGRTRRARQTRRTAPLLCVGCGSTRHTSTTAAQPRSPTSWRITTRFVVSGLPRSSSGSLLSI